MAEEQKTHIDAVRQLMLDQLRALRVAPAGDGLAEELKRAKGVAELSQTLINSAKVEVEYLQATGQDRSDFLETPPQITTGNVAQPQLPFPTHAKQVSPGDGNGITSIVRHRLKG